MASIRMAFVRGFVSTAFAPSVMKLDISAGAALPVTPIEGNIK